MVSTLNRQAAPMQGRTIPLDSAEQQFIISVPDENSQARSNILCVSEENLVMNPKRLYDKTIDLMPHLKLVQGYHYANKGTFFTDNGIDAKATV